MAVNIKFLPMVCGKGGYVKHAYKGEKTMTEENEIVVAVGVFAVALIMMFLFGVIGVATMLWRLFG